MSLGNETQNNDPHRTESHCLQRLIDHLGYVNAIRFFKQFETGNGDYTQERHQWLDSLSLDEIWADIQKRQS
ncbi:MAG: hypothetical protein HC857_16140 [Synechococcales cyanobacterium RU_4_20]|nr:hypothetical protein [Synechococcales cyanobacterium RU_4_20]